MGVKLHFVIKSVLSSGCRKKCVDYIGLCSYGTSHPVRKTIRYNQSDCGFAVLFFFGNTPEAHRSACFYRKFRANRGVVFEDRWNPLSNNGLRKITKILPHVIGVA